jgi:hypothetical protein
MIKIAIPAADAGEKLSNKAWALLYASWGWSVFPAYNMVSGADDVLVCSCDKGAECGRPGKHPRTTKGLDDATTDRLKIERWWGKWPTANIAIATGSVSGLTVVDADASKGKPGVLNLTTLAAANGGLPATLKVNTGGGGLHLFLKWSPNLKTGANILAEAIDVRSDGGYVIVPPSNHASGGKYVWDATSSTLAEVPAWMTTAREDASSTSAKHRRGRPRKHAAFKFEKMESLLRAIDPDDREKWLAVGVILGRLYLGSGLENDAWELYESWAGASTKFDEDRAGNISRMQEAFHERSQEDPRAGGEALGAGSIIKWAKEAGWTPFGERKPVEFEPGNELVMAEALAEALLDVKPEAIRHFNVMGQLRDVVKAPLAVPRFIRRAFEDGRPVADTLVVRATSTHGLLGAVMRRAALRSVDRHGADTLVPIPVTMMNLILEELSGMFPPLGGIAEWPMVGDNGDLIMKPRGYDPSTGFYFEIDPSLKINEKMTLDTARHLIMDELLCDFPFEQPLHAAAALGLLLSFMQRPLMKICPAFAVVAPQPGSGKSTLIEAASLAVHGFPVASHAWSLEPEELRKAIHSLLMAKVPAVLFDNVARGQAVSSDHLSKLITSEIATDRKLGASETRKEVNNLLVTFTGNNIAFVRDMASRVINVRLNPKMDNPLRRQFKHRDIRRWVYERRSDWLSALIVIVRCAIGDEAEGAPSRFEDFDRIIAAPVLKLLGEDIRALLTEESEDDAEEDGEMRSMMTLLWRWQQQWRASDNGQSWATAEVVEAVDSKTMDDSCIRILQRGCGSLKSWEQDPSRALGAALKAVNGSYRFNPLVIVSKKDSHTKSNKWIIKGGPDLGSKNNGANGGF